MRLKAVALLQCTCILPCFVFALLKQTAALYDYLSISGFGLYMPLGCDHIVFQAQP
jgi:hypothetical protein